MSPSLKRVPPAFLKTAELLLPVARTNFARRSIALLMARNSVYRPARGSRVFGGRWRGPYRSHPSHRLRMRRAMGGPTAEPDHPRPKRPAWFERTRQLGNLTRLKP